MEQGSQLSCDQNYSIFVEIFMCAQSSKVSKLKKEIHFLNLPECPCAFTRMN